MPRSRFVESGSCGRNRSPSRIVKSGTVAWAIAATPESTCCSPQAISQNGIGVGDHAEHGPLPPRGPQLRPRTPRAHGRDDVAEQDDRGEGGAPEHER